MPRVEFEPTIPAFERAKAVHALDRAATVIGDSVFTPFIFLLRFIHLSRVCEAYCDMKAESKKRLTRKDVHS
jgi:hypothetical protein